MSDFPQPATAFNHAAYKRRNQAKSFAYTSERLLRRATALRRSAAKNLQHKNACKRWPECQQCGSCEHLVMVHYDNSAELRQFDLRDVPAARGLISALRTKQSFASAETFALRAVKYRHDRQCLELNPNGAYAPAQAEQPCTKLTFVGAH